MGLAYPLTWPLDSKGFKIRPTEISLALAQTSRSGGQSYTGIEQTVTSPAARWECKMTFPHMDRVTTLTWRGFIAAMQGRLGSVNVPVWEAGRQPWPSDAWGRRLTPGVARAPKLGGTAYAVDPGRLPVISVTCAAAAKNATTLLLTATSAGPILAGHRFSIGSTLYEITQSIGNSDGTATVSIRPWLRAAAGATTVCEFASPVCAMRFKTDGEGSLELQANRFANPTLNLVEAL